LLFGVLKGHDFSRAAPTNNNPIQTPNADSRVRIWRLAETLKMAAGEGSQIPRMPTLSDPWQTE
jgi:hypothetical protein